MDCMELNSAQLSCHLWLLLFPSLRQLNYFELGKKLGMEKKNVLFRFDTAVIHSLICQLQSIK